MGEIAETVSEAVEKVPAEEPRLGGLIAVLVAATATFMALCNVKDGNIAQAMSQDQANAVDTWSYYQAKGTKENIAEATLDQLVIDRDRLPPAAALGGGEVAHALAAERALLDRKIAEYEAKVKLYAAEKQDIKTAAQAFQHHYDALNVRDDQFDMAEALMSISIALYGITALTRRRALMVVAIAFMSLGAVLGIAGFAGLSFHPDALARLLGA